MITNNLETQINKNKYNCQICKKEYSRKTSLDKHRLLCEYKTKTKTELTVEEEEIGDKPSYAQLVKIVQELSIKYAQMETKMDEMQQWINRRKKKQDVIGWLNGNINASIGFLEWITMTIHVDATHFEYLMKSENNIFQTYHLILENNIKEQPDFVYPICCFRDKANIFYICEKDETLHVSIWRQMEPTEFIQIVKKIHNLLVGELTKWKKWNREKIDENDKLSDLFNKAVIKLMNITFTSDGATNINKIRNIMYNMPQLLRQLL